MGGRDGALGALRSKKIEEILISLRVQLRGHIVEEQDGCLAMGLGEELELRDLPGQDERSELALRRKGRS
jgi:hypothetical protein